MLDLGIHLKKLHKEHKISLKWKEIVKTRTAIKQEKKVPYH